MTALLLHPVSEMVVERAESLVAGLILGAAAAGLAFYLRRRAQRS